MNPKHINCVPEFIKDDKGRDLPRRAIAPYNFVELPDQVVEAELPLPEGDRYYPNRYTGKIECTLTTESPLYIRCGLTTEEFQAEEESKDLPDFFYTDPATKSEKPVLPGSSIRGMLRTLVEIVSFSKIDRVSDEHRLFFRAVAANKNKESWGKEYKKYVEPKKNLAGYLKKDSGKWYIQPAKSEKGATFAWVRETELNLPNFKIFNDDEYEPQYISVSYRSVDVDETDIPKRLFAHDVELPDTQPKKGVLVTSGSMKQKENESSPRRNHCVVFAKNENAHRLQINDTAIEHYRNALTDFQKKSPFDKDWGVLEENRPVFYCPPENGNKVGFFGQSPNFRIPYSPQGNGQATTVVDFIPEDLRELAFLDLADAIFGWVKQESKDEKLPEGFDKQRAGRVFFTDAVYKSSQNNIWYQDKPLTLQILSSPKPSDFSHYLVQPNAEKSELKHYASNPIQETVIRGHKLYWHKGSNPEFKLKLNLDNKKEVSDTQTTQIKPIKKGVIFKFDIHFENLSDVELGALLWVLNVAQYGAYRLKLGMGKPLGLGSIKIEPTLYLSNRQGRYQNLFDSNNFWEKGETENNKDISNYVSKFEGYVLKKLNYTGNFKNLCRIQMLLAMLSWPGSNVGLTRYMEIERDVKKPHIGKPVKSTDKTVNEYKDRPVLPNPLDVMRIKIECDHPSPSLPKKSTSQLTQQFSEGQEIDAKVVGIEVQKGNKVKTTIIYDIPGSDCQAKEEIYKHTVALSVGDLLKVSIVKAQGKSVRKVKRV
jgi:CRISPR-associated protein (TIGR03986 family)